MGKNLRALRRIERTQQKKIGKLTIIQKLNWVRINGKRFKLVLVWHIIWLLICLRFIHPTFRTVLDQKENVDSSTKLLNIKYKYYYTNNMQMYVTKVVTMMIMQKKMVNFHHENSVTFQVKFLNFRFHVFLIMFPSFSLFSLLRCGLFWLFKLFLSEL